MNDDARPSRPRVAVVFGGRSGEHSVSCATAAGVLREIDRSRFDVIPVGITRQGRWVTMPDDPVLLEGGRAEVAEITTGAGDVVVPMDTRQLVELAPASVPAALGAVDVVLPLLHGPFGEDGTIQGLLEMANLRYVGPGVLSSAIGMDKHHTKVTLAASGFPVAPYVVATGRRWTRDPEGVLAAAAALRFPVFVKPARAGSSLGISRVTSPDGLRAAIETARLHDPKVLIEEGVPGREIECGVLEGRDGAPPRTAPLGEVVMHSQTSEFYDFETKYFDTEGFSMVCPADLPADLSERIRELAARAFDALECEGLARVDFFVPEHGEPVVNEINTMPGFTPYSMFPVMWQAAGMSYRELVTELLELALARPTGLR